MTSISFSSTSLVPPYSKVYCPILLVTVASRIGDIVSMEACAFHGVLAALCSALTTYNITHNHVIRFKNGVFPEVSNVQQWVARIVTCMVEPCLQDEFHAGFELQNADSTRLAVQAPDLRITNSRQRIVERMTRDFINNPDFVPQSNPSMVFRFVRCVCMSVFAFVCACGCMCECMVVSACACALT